MQEFLFLHIFILSCHLQLILLFLCSAEHKSVSDIFTFKRTIALICCPLEVNISWHEFSDSLSQICWCTTFLRGKQRWTLNKPDRLTRTCEVKVLRPSSFWDFEWMTNTATVINQIRGKGQSLEVLVKLDNSVSISRSPPAASHFPPCTSSRRHWLPPPAS